MDSNELGVDESFSFTFNEVGEFPYFCKVHGEGDMEGRIIVGGPPEPCDDPNNPDCEQCPPKDKNDPRCDFCTEHPNCQRPGGTLLSFECDKAVAVGPSGIEALSLTIGETTSCVLELTDRSIDKRITNFVRGNGNVVTIVADE